jgi:hypothetical protein
VGRRRPPAAEASIGPSLSTELRPGDELLQRLRQFAALFERSQLHGAHKERAVAPCVGSLNQSSVELRFVSPGAQACHGAAQPPARKRAYPH